QPLPARPRASSRGDGGAGHGAAREGEAPRARQSVDPRGARHRLFPHPPLPGGGIGVPLHARPLAGGRLRPLRARPLPREAGQADRGTGPLQARELATAVEQAVLRQDPRAHLKAVVQRVSRARVRVGGETVGQIGAGLVVLFGVARGDRAVDADRPAEKIAKLRIFEDHAGRFDQSVVETGGELLAVSQFTLLADTGKGNRPSFTGAAPPDEAEPAYEAFCAALRTLGVPVETGVFGARMELELVNDGPVTIILDV